MFSLVTSASTVSLLPRLFPTHSAQAKLKPPISGPTHQYSHLTGDVSRKSHFPKLNKTGQVKRITNTYSIRGYCQRTPFSCAGCPEKIRKIQQLRRFLKSDCMQPGIMRCTFSNPLYRRVYRRFYAVSRDRTGIVVTLYSWRSIFFNFCFGNCRGDMRINCGVSEKVSLEAFSDD